MVRVEKKPGAAADGIAFGAGVYDNATRTSLADFKAQLTGTPGTYHSYMVGTVELSPDRDIWVAPASNQSVRAIYVDRVYLVPEQ